MMFQANKDVYKPQNITNKNIYASMTNSTYNTCKSSVQVSMKHFHVVKKDEDQKPIAQRLYKSHCLCAPNITINKQSSVMLTVALRYRTVGKQEQFDIEKYTSILYLLCQLAVVDYSSSEVPLYLP